MDGTEQQNEADVLDFLLNSPLLPVLSTERKGLVELVGNGGAILHRGERHSLLVPETRVEQCKRHAILY